MPARVDIELCENSRCFNLVKDCIIIDDMSEILLFDKLSDERLGRKKHVEEMVWMMLSERLRCSRAGKLVNMKG